MRLLLEEDINDPRFQGATLDLIIKTMNPPVKRPPEVTSKEAKRTFLLKNLKVHCHAFGFKGQLQRIRCTSTFDSNLISFAPPNTGHAWLDAEYVTEVMWQNWLLTSTSVSCAQNTSATWSIVKSLLKDVKMPQKQGMTREDALAEWRAKRDA